MNFKPILTTLAVAALTSMGVNARTDAFLTKAPGLKLGRSVLQPNAASKLTGKQADVKALSRAASNLPDGTVLYEDFEEWDGVTENFVPEGWTIDNVKLPAGHPGWKVYPPDILDPVNYPSKTYIFLFFEEPVDSRLISPEFEVTDGMVLSADIYNAGDYYYEIDAEMYTSVINSIEKRNDFIVNISTDGGTTWTPVHSMADDMLSEGYTLAFQYYERMGWEKVSVDLSEFAGQKIRVAFQVVGEPDSNSAGVDNIRVGYPTVNVSYMRPADALFYGLTNQDEAFPATIMVVPAHSPVTYVNSSEATGNIDYSWNYGSDDVEGSVEGGDLTATYGTSGLAELQEAGKATSQGKDFDMPVLTASGKNVSETTFKLPGYLQVGGVGQSTIVFDGTPYLYDFGLSVADPYTEGTSTYADITVPYFGYNVESDRYWTMYTFDLSYAEYQESFSNDPDNKAELTHYANMYYTSEAPIVINGIRSNGYGRGTGLMGNMNGAQLKAEIYLMKDAYDEFGNWMGYEMPETPTYSIPGTVKLIDRSASNYILIMNFVPEEPIVISGADCPAYVVAITGFHDADHIEYFSPELSLYDNPDGLIHGIYGTKIKYEGVELPLGWGYVFRHCMYNREPEGEQNRSFYIMFDGAYPWLERADKSDEAIDLSEGQAVTVDLNSYHHADNLTIEGVPSWLNAELTGRYDKTKLVLTPIAEGSTATITVKGHGVSKDIQVIGTSGLNDIVDDAGTDADAVYFDLKGVRVINPEKGQILIKKQGTKATKVAIR